MWNAIAGLFSGIVYPVQVLVILQRLPRLWKYIVIPILLNVAIAIGLYLGLLFPGLNSIENLITDLSQTASNVTANWPSWLGWLTAMVTFFGWLLQGLLVVLLLVVVGFLLVQIGVTLGSPWYGQLSEELEAHRTGTQPPTPEGTLAILQDIWRAILFEVKKLLLAAAVSLLLFLCNLLVPVVGSTIASLGGIALAATIVCLDFLDAPLERRRLQFREKLGVVFRSFPASGSFSLVCLFLISFPVINFFTVPICVASGTLFFCDRVLPRWQKSSATADSAEA
ncbi:EI24 domain-containing protein [Geitlerinema sp. PCC 9228]|uniref:EI24 domain-containing protein n=1 Tax=Geitlerinema sp. PCC 9228 TaxID=111611 RepID=UPI0008F9E2A5|nr:EI24 domain-containing protein [Geitlerinema sp. PCC 9228]